jgi:hypothetical protein
MDKTAQVVHPISLHAVPLNNICIVLGTPVDSSPILPSSNPARTNEEHQLRNGVSTPVVEQKT